MQELLLLWGKSHPEKSLLAHCIDVGCCAQVLLKEGCGQVASAHMSKLINTSTAQLCNLVGYLAALHDIGKIHPFFQCRASELICIQSLIAEGRLSTSLQSTNFRHEQHTNTVLHRIWSTSQIMDEDWSETLRTALSLHHQGKRGTDALIPSNYQKDWWELQQSKFEFEVRNLFFPALESLNHCSHTDAFATLLTGLVILADWIASGSSFDGVPWESSAQYIQASHTQALVAVRDCGLLEATSLPPCGAFTDLWADFTPEGLRPMQILCQQEKDNPAALYIIEAPMGEGKTECGLYLANLMCHSFGRKGVYFALPTMATSNQMYTRMNQLLQQKGVKKSRLLHAMAWLVDRDMPEIQSDSSEEASTWLAPLRRGLLANYAVGTVDQAMMAVLMAKYTVLRLVGLSSKVLIIDEIHAYDTYMSRILERLLEWCRALKIPVILLSATLPSSRKTSLLAAYGTPTEADEHYPLLTAANWSGDVTQQTCGTYMAQTFHFKLLPENRLVSTVLDYWHQHGGCLCVLANTVGGAQEIFSELLVQGVPREEILLFHARFTAGARQHLEQTCISLFGKSGQRPKRFIVVGTQVLEQSLDVDFDIMFSEIAPIDLLLQRAGRVFRHRETLRPPAYTQANIYVSCPSGKDFGGSSVIYTPLLLHRTHILLEENGQVAVPGHMRRVIEQVYQETFTSEELTQGMKMQFQQQLAQSQADGVILTAPNPRYFFATEMGAPFDLFTREDEDSTLVGAAKTRQGEENISVAFLPKALFHEATVERPTRDIAQQVLLHSVSLRSKSIESLLPQGIEGQGLLKRCHLFCLEISESLSSEKCILRNDIDLGIVIEGM